jgi:hypothetical protein
MTSGERHYLIASECKFLSLGSSFEPLACYPLRVSEHTKVPPAASLFSATLCSVLNNLSDFRWPPKYLRSRQRHANRGWKSWVQDRYCTHQSVTVLTYKNATEPTDIIGGENRTILMILPNAAWNPSRDLSSFRSYCSFHGGLSLQAF